MQGHVGKRIHVEWAGVRPKTVAWCEGEVIFSEGDDADDILYVVNGLVKVSAPGRREAVVGVLGSDDFFGEVQSPSIARFSVSFHRSFGVVCDIAPRLTRRSKSFYIGTDGRGVAHEPG